jgi:hypothetical protein
LTRLAVDVLAVAVNVLNRLNKRFIVAVDVVDADMVLNSVNNRLMLDVLVDVTVSDLTYFSILEMVLVLVDVADNVGVSFIVS